MSVVNIGMLKEEFKGAAHRNIVLKNIPQVNRSETIL